MRRAIISWTVVFAFLVAGFAASVAALNSDLYSARGFVEGYLGALARHDSVAALALPGVRTANDTAADLLDPDALGRIDDIAFVSDVEQAGGVHRVTFRYSFERGGGRSEFLVSPDGARLGLFTKWKFAASPLATVSVNVLHDTTFTANGLTVRSDAAAGAPASFLVFAPGLYVLGHDSAYLTAEPVDVVVAETGGIVDAEVDVQANGEFVDLVQQELDAALDECTTQRVLMPTGCPFGQEMTNRIDNLPLWTMVDYPTIAIRPGAEPGAWEVPPARGTAHILVKVRSLFDGTISTFDEDVPFTVHYTIAFDSQGTLTITAVFG